MLRNEDFKKMSEVGLDKISTLKYLYKYVNLNDGLNYILKENTFRFTNPIEFNDPFDCNEQLVHISVDTQKGKEILKEASLIHNISRKAQRQQLKKIGDVKSYTNALKNKKKEYKVSCFSEIPDEILMWSHYADKHSGLCIKFELDFMSDEYVFYPVNYISEVQKVDGMTNAPYVFYYFVTVKADRWAYEKEIRAISKNGNTIISYPKLAVKEVIFGCNVKPDVIAQSIKEIKKMRYKNLVFSKMDLDAQSLGVKKTIIR